MKNVLEMLEINAEKFKDKLAVIDSENSLSYNELFLKSKGLGSALLDVNKTNQPIAVYMDKSANQLVAMLGVVYSGNFYTVIDSEMPINRIQKVFFSLKPIAIITDRKNFDNARMLGVEKIVLYDEAVNTAINDAKLNDIRKSQIDTDLLYTLYTSGSTGVPKGAVISHRNVIVYSKWAVDTFDFNENTIFGNQTPFYFSMSVTDIYSTLRVGATLVIIPKALFSFPIKLIEFLNLHKVNTIYWVPSAISIVSNLKLFEYSKPKYLNKVLFAGEAMPTKQLNYWIDNLDNSVMYANLFGPTETTDICTYYVVDRKFRNDESLPIGKHCDNCDVLIINEKGERTSINEIGEMYVRGSFLSFGYYNNYEKTNESFVQNPLNKSYPEIVYKTGDLVMKNEEGELIFVGRADYQIKHMGYRIELGEIETAVNANDEVKECACIFDEIKDKIVLFYSSKRITENELMNSLKQKLNSYLLPNVLIKMPQLPHNQNGKIDRKELKENYYGKNN